MLPLGSPVASGGPGTAAPLLEHAPHIASSPALQGNPVKRGPSRTRHYAFVTKCQFTWACHSKLPGPKSLAPGRCVVTSGTRRYLASLCRPPHPHSGYGAQVLSLRPNYRPGFLHFLLVKMLLKTVCMERGLQNFLLMD
ncbi:hypothetical protein HJG60_008403 [Phyllostomus discolor]|uniref:Uncharacterized protein n=1 Tax=Phyllostomus discolor TaxID=89673 RepID=A0A834DQD5_9CHIR|nr:hypothetical protein HJG60_008403 [Phyllostomus discolor]